MNMHDKPWMKSFSTAELARKTGDVTHAASQAPVSITQHKKPRFVMMSVEMFERLNPQRSYGVDEIPDEILEWLVPGLEKIASDDFNYED
jgi:PHD/YefM family antitoxin component YafN of YafNO toxin-antitoxin module